MMEATAGRNIAVRQLYLAMLVVFFFFLSPAAAAERSVEGPVMLEADQVTYDKEGDTYQASGNVIITFTDGFLTADSVVYDRKTDDVLAEGDVFILQKDDTLEGDKVRFNVATKRGVVYRGKAFLAENHFYIAGTEIQKRGETTYRIKDAEATTCDGPDPAWKFTAKQLDVTVDGYGKMEQGTFDVRDFPTLYFPYFVFPAKTKRQSGFLLPKASFSSDKNGWDVELPFFWAISDSADATFYQRYMDKRGWKEGVEFRYSLSKDSFGTFYADYLNDTKGVSEVDGDRVRDWTENHRRWSYFLNHETTFSPGFYLRTDIARVSDHWYFKDFSSSNYFLDNYSPEGTNKFKRIGFYADQSLPALDSTARLVKEWGNYNLTTFVKYTDNLALPTNDTTPQSYPYVTFSAVNHPIFGSPVNFQLASSYQYVYRAEGEKGHWVDAYPVFSLPYNFGDYLQVTPLVGFRGTAWEGRGGLTDKDGDREIYTLGLNASTEVHRVFNTRLGSVDKVQHTIRPEVTYSYVPNAKKDNLPDFVAAVPETNAVTYSLTNTMIAKVKEDTKDKKAVGPERLAAPAAEKYSYVEFLRFVVSQTYDIKEQRSSKPEAERRPFSPVMMDLILTPHQYVTYRGQYTFDVNDGEWKTMDHDLTLKDRRGDSATVSYRYAQDALEEIDLYLKAKLTNAVNLTFIRRRNEFDKKDMETTYGVQLQKQCWSVEFTYSDMDDDKRFMVMFSLFGLGKVGGMGAQAP